MEVLLRNVPIDLSDANLGKELQPLMKALDIQDWDCQKPRKKPNAWVVFLEESDGARFLKKHEPTTPPGALSNDPRRGTRPRQTAGLWILKAPVYVVKSTRRIDKHTLGHLRHEREARARAPPRESRPAAFSCNVHRLACGHNMFVGPEDTLTFIEEDETTTTTFAKFSRQSLSLSQDGSRRLDIAYRTVQQIIACRSDHTLTLVLTQPPTIYRRNEEMLGVRSPFNWYRETGLDSFGMQSSLIGQCLVYRLQLSGMDFNPVVKLLSVQELLSVSQQELPLSTNPEPYEQMYSTGMTSFEGRLGSLGSSAPLLPFSLAFQVQALVLNNYLHQATGRRMIDIMKNKALKCKAMKSELLLTTDSMKILFQEIPYPIPGTSPHELDEKELLGRVVDRELSLRKEDPLRVKEYGVKIYDHQAWVLKATVTPTRILLSGPDAESKNTVLRKYANHNSYFLRVQFCDEDGQDLSFNPKVSNDHVYDRYRRVLRDGIRIAGRRFSFLGFSHSSLRSHSAWFQAPFIDSSMQRQDYDTILRSLGKFDEIGVPARCAARIGQAFSETPFAVPVFESEILVKYIPDVKSADGERVFSDGVGTISHQAMQEVWHHLPMRRAAPTCFQIRLAGIKGMIALDSRLKGKVICIRKESMMKFSSSDFSELGICDASSTPLRLVLNRQMIKIMEDMGTPDEWFFDQQNKALAVLRGVTSTAANTATFLERQALGTGMGFPRLIRQLERMGLDYRREKFLRSVVEHIVMRELRLLKHKARIPVAKGVTLFGIMDETGFLDEEEVYITYDKKSGQGWAKMDPSLADGPVMVTRSPALHPGDVQVATMVTPPEGHPLRHLENCIVFSQKGSRDLPSQLSGGDLDGDLYNVIWDWDALPERVFDPADYPRVAPKPLNRGVTRDDIADFFIDFMKTDILGLIANRHQILADVREKGTLDGDCMDLASMHSTAVDFSKTGIPVMVGDIPKAPRTRPDFLAPAPPLKLYDLGQISHIAEVESDGEDGDELMGRAKHRYHKSEKILGKLFRSVEERKIWTTDIKRNTHLGGPSLWTKLISLVQSRVVYYGLDVDHKRQMEEAWRIRDLYESAVSGTMWQFSENPRKPITEVEAFCGSILNATGSQTRRQRDASIKLKEEVDRIMEWIVKLIRDRGGGGGGAGDDGDDASVDGDGGQHRGAEKALELCWACLEASLVDTAEAAAHHGTAALHSFRAVAASCLVRELSALPDKTGAAGGGGGFVGVSGGYGSKMALPMR